MPSDAASPGQPAEAGTDSTLACSCEAALDQGGRVHVCSEGHEPSVCAELGCEQGTLRESACPNRTRARLCCDMQAAGLTTISYDDCDHPNCELGFRVQCRDFGGDLYVGQCSSGVRAPESDAGTYSDSGGTRGERPASDASSCAAVPLARGSRCPWLVVALSGLARLARSRRAPRKPLIA